MTRLLNICSSVLWLGLKPASSSASSFLSHGLESVVDNSEYNLVGMADEANDTIVLTLLEVASLWYRYDKQLCPFFRPFLLLSDLHAYRCRDGCCRFTFILKQPWGNVVHYGRFSCFQTTHSLSSLSSAQIGFQHLVWGSDYSGVGLCLDGLVSYIEYGSTESTGLELLCLPSECFHCCLRWLLTYAVGSWWEPWGCCRPSCCFLTSFSSLCFCTAPQSTLFSFFFLLLPLSSSWLLCSLFCTLVLLQYLCTSVVSAAVSGRTDPEPLLWHKVDLFPLSHKDLFVASFSLFARGFTSLSRTHAQRAANFPHTLAWNTSAIFGSLSFSGSNRIRGLFVKSLVFSFNLMVVSLRSLLPPMSVLEQDLVFALLMMDLKLWVVRLKSIWLWTCPLGTNQVAAPDNLWGWKVLARINRWFFTNSRSRHPVSFISPMPNLPTVRA